MHLFHIQRIGKMTEKEPIIKLTRKKGTEREKEIEKEEFGKQIQRLRKQKGFSQRVLARHAQLSIKLIRKIEQTGYIPHIETLLQLSDGLGINIHTMLDTIPQIPAQLQTQFQAQIQAQHKALAKLKTQDLTQLQIEALTQIPAQIQAQIQTQVEAYFAIYEKLYFDKEEK